MTPSLPKLLDDQRPRRRRVVREMCEVLRSDLYQRTGSEFDPPAAVWTSPLKWVVAYGYDEVAEGHQAIWCEVRRPDGQVYERDDDVDAEWLAAALP